MTQKQLADYLPGEPFEGFLMLRSGETRTSKAGKTYLDMTLGDCSGEINAKRWNGDMALPAPSTVLYIRGQVEDYQGRLQLRVEAMRAANDGEADLSILVPSAPESAEVYLREINETIDGMQSVALRRIVKEMLSMCGDKLIYFPGGQRLHHAERTGLLHHTVGMLRTAKQLLQVYPFLRADLLLSGVIIHDLCKIWEMKSSELGVVSDYSTDGLLIGHIVRGVTMIHEAAKKVGVSGETVVLLEHMLLSHHGVPEYGSPKLPMFPEAEVLHTVDLLDARMNEMMGIEDRTPAGAFSEKIWSLDRRLYHPRYDCLDEEPALEL